MVWSLAIAASGFSPREALFSAIEARLADPGPAAVEIRETEATIGEPVQARFLFRRGIDGLRIDAQKPGGGIIQTFQISTEKTQAIDPALSQYTEAKAPADGRYEVELRRLAPELSEASLALSDPVYARMWLAQIRGSGKWSYRRTGGRFVLSSGSAVVEAREGDLALLRLRLGSGRRLSETRLAHLAPPRGAVLAPTQSLSKTEVLSPLAIRPQYENATAREVMEQMLASYDGLKRIGYEVTEAGRRTRVLLNGSRMRQDDDLVSWTYDGRIFRLFDKKTRRFAEGEAKFIEVVDAVGEAGSRVEPMGRSLAVKSNPFRLLITDRAEVRREGRMQIQGRPADIVFIKGDTGEFTIAVDQSSRRAISIVSKAGGSDEAFTRMFRYLPDSELKDAAFRLPKPAGAKTASVEDFLSEETKADRARRASS